MGHHWHHLVMPHLRLLVFLVAAAGQLGYADFLGFKMPFIENRHNSDMAKWAVSRPSMTWVAMTTGWHTTCYYIILRHVFETTMTHTELRRPVQPPSSSQVYTPTRAGRTATAVNSSIGHCSSEAGNDWSPVSIEMGDYGWFYRGLLEFISIYDLI